MLKIVFLLLSIGYFNEANYYLLYSKYPLTAENVKMAIYDLNIQYPESSYELSKNESGNFKSRIAKEYNNIWGMKFPRKRTTLAIGRGISNYAKYDCWLSSVIDYKIWQGPKRIQGDYTKYLRKRRWW